MALSVTDFGADGPYRSWVGTDAVFYAMSTALSRSGPATGTPVLPPIGIASASAAAQAAWAVLAAYYHRLRHGGGDYIDFSRFEAVVQALDPPFGLAGAGGVRSEALRRLAGPAPQPADLSDVPVSRRVRPDLSALGAAMARYAGLAGVNPRSSAGPNSIRSRRGSPRPYR